MRRTPQFAGTVLALGALFAILATSVGADPKAPAAARPRMVDLGSDSCIPCKKMAPMLEQLRADYAGIVEIAFIDVKKAPAAGRQYKIRLIPTQVFFDSGGEEVFRHEGYFSREEIEKVFKERLGVAPVPAGSAKEEKKDSSGLMTPDREDDPLASSQSLLAWRPSSAVLRAWSEEAL